MKAICLGLFLVSQSGLACMSDKACVDASNVSMCCYMNECVPSSNIGCSGQRLDFYAHLQTLKEAQELQTFAEKIRENSEKVANCDQLGIHCIDYVTNLMSDAGVFSSLDGVSELKEV